MERRRRFEHLFVELSVALGELAPRYALWLRIAESRGDPEELSSDSVSAFCREDLSAFLTEHGLALAPRKLRRLIATVSKFDASQRTPEEQLTALFERTLGPP